MFDLVSHSALYLVVFSDTPLSIFNVSTILIDFCENNVSAITPFFISSELAWMANLELILCQKYLHSRKCGSTLGFFFLMNFNQPIEIIDMCLHLIKGGGKTLLVEYCFFFYWYKVTVELEELKQESKVLNTKCNLINNWPMYIYI